MNESPRTEPEFQLLGFTRAFGRITGHGSKPGDLIGLEMAAREKGETIMDSFGTFAGTLASAVEAIYWATSLDERIRKDWPLEEPWYLSIEGAELMRGIRFARNRVHHQWAHAIGLPPGEQLRGNTAAVEIQWLWPLPEPSKRFRDPEGEQVYLDSMRGESVLTTLSPLMSAFTSALARLLELGVTYPIVIGGSQRVADPPTKP